MGFSMSRILMALVLLLSITNIYANKIWEVKGNYIESVSIFNDTVGSTGYNVLEVVLKDPINTGCAGSDNGNVIRYWIDKPVTPTMHAWQAALLAAQAQGAKVDIRTDASICSNTYGRKYIGTRIYSTH